MKFNSQAPGNGTVLQLHVRPKGKPAENHFVKRQEKERRTLVCSLIPAAVTPRCLEDAFDAPLD